MFFNNYKICNQKVLYNVNNKIPVFKSFTINMKEAFIILFKLSLSFPS